jgi:starch phosphorylase
VPAGNDEFPAWLIDKYFSGVWCDLWLNLDQFIDLAKVKTDWSDEVFSMPVLALRLSDYRNGVSKLHGEVSRKMWQYLWPETPAEEVPITYITNGVHTGTWLARRLGVLYNRYLGPDWKNNLDDPAMWERIENIPDDDLWRVRLHLKRKLINYMVGRARYQWENTSVHPVQTVASGVLLDPQPRSQLFCASFCHLQNARTCSSGLRSPAAADCHECPQACSDRFCRQKRILPTNPENS